MIKKLRNQPYAPKARASSQMEVKRKEKIWCLLGVNRSPFSEPIANNFAKQTVGTNRTNTDLDGICSYHAASLWIGRM
jgi:hypothetical protein